MLWSMWHRPQVAPPRFMPDHGDGTSVVPTVEAEGDSYSVQHVYLFMAGLREVTIEATSGETNDSAVLRFCIEG